MLAQSTNVHCHNHFTGRVRTNDVNNFYVTPKDFSMYKSVTKPFGRIKDFHVCNRQHLYTRRMLFQLFRLRLPHSMSGSRSRRQCTLFNSSDTLSRCIESLSWWCKLLRLVKTKVPSSSFQNSEAAHTNLSETCPLRVQMFQNVIKIGILDVHRCIHTIG